MSTLFDPNGKVAVIIESSRGIGDEQFRKVLNNNVLANHWLAQPVQPGMIARWDGDTIVTISGP